MPLSEAPTPSAAPRPLISPEAPHPTEPQLILGIQPSIIAAIALRLTVIIFSLTLVLFAVNIANHYLGYDMITALLRYGQEASVNLAQFSPEFAMLLQRAFDTLTTLMITVALICAAGVLLRGLPMVTKRWRLYEDRIEYATGTLFVKDHLAPLAAIAIVGSKRYLPFLDIGSITMVLSGVTQPITIPMVVGADEKVERIRTIQHAAQEGWMRQSQQDATR